MDPTISLTFAVQKNPGVYAVLLGSGVSRAARVPTGWDVVEDLVRQVARLQGDDPQPDPVAWFRATFEREPGYSDLLEQLGRSPAERGRLLRGYFEPTAEERAEGVKVPTAAHRAIAGLASSGHVRVIVSTNFDRLMEHALEEVGVRPQVVASADAAAGMLPLAHAPCTLVKLHGDYLDTRILNTSAELERYPPQIDRLLDQILDEYGLIVCGWSADWDTALRAAIERCPNRRFTTFWVTRGEPGETAARLIELRQAEVVRAVSADRFFGKLAEDVTSLESLARPHPLSARAAQAAVKRYVVEPRDRIRLHDLATDEAGRILHALTGGDAFPLHAPLTGEALVERLRRCEALSEVLMAIMATGCYWGETAHHSVWTRAMERQGTVPGPGSGTFYDAWLKLRRYPALLALYAGGIAAIAADRYDALAALLTQPMIRDYRTGNEEPLVLAVNSWDVMEIDVGRLMPGKQNNVVPLSDHIFFESGLRDTLREAIPDDTRFLAAFDRFEYLTGLVHADENEKHGGSWLAPVGSFVWRHGASFVVGRMTAVTTAVAEFQAQGAAWPPLAAGLFDGSTERLLQVMTNYHQSIATWRH